MAPEFVALLESVPAGQRRGFVFDPQPRRVHGFRLTTHRVGELLSEIGKAARIVVRTDANGQAKYATAHDLRRSFGEKWANRLMPQQLMELMRHESIETTLRYYVGRNAKRTAAVLWQAHDTASNNTFTTRGPIESHSQDVPADATPITNVLSDSSGAGTRTPDTRIMIPLL